MARSKQIDIKRALALASVFTFLFSCARGCLLPFLTLYLRQLGLGPAMTGLILGAKHLVTLLWSPVSSLLSKHYNKRRAVIVGSLVCSAAAALILPLVPPSDPHLQLSICNASNVSAAPAETVGDLLLKGSSVAPTEPLAKEYVSPPAVTSPVKTSAGEKSPPLTTIQALVDQVDSTGRRKRSKIKSEPTPEEVNSFEFLGYLKVMDPQHQLFFLVLIIVVVWEFLSAPLEWTADDGLYEYLDFADASDRHVNTRLWSLLGGAVGAAGAGLLVSYLSCMIAGQTPRSDAHFYCYAGFSTVALLAAHYLPLYLNKKRERANGLLKAVQLVRGSSRALLCAVTTMLVGAAAGAVDNFLLWQMQDHGSTELHMGLSVALALTSQACFPLMAGKLSKLMTSAKLLAAGVAMLSLQCLYYSFLWGPWAALPAQATSCLSSGALWWAVSVQCEDIATAEAERNVRRVFSALTLHLGSSLGSCATGLVAERFGLAWLFRGLSGALLLWCGGLLLLQWKTPNQRKINYSRLLAANASEASESESEQERDWLDKAMEETRGNKYGRTSGKY